MTKAQKQAGIECREQALSPPKEVAN